MVMTTNKSNQKGEKVTLEELVFIQKTYVQDLNNMNLDEFIERADKKETVRLFFGTSTDKLNSILKNGIPTQERASTARWKGMKVSMKNVTYLTDKWHYFYAVNDCLAHVRKETPNNSLEESYDAGVFPCYIECEIPKELLVMDEDYLITRHMAKKVEKVMVKGGELTLDPMECLEKYGTVGVMGAVKPESIKSFTVLGEPGMFNYIADTNGQYIEDWRSWGKSGEKGKLKRKNLVNREQKSKMNVNWELKDIGKGVKIKEICKAPQSDCLSLHLEVDE